MIGLAVLLLAARVPFWNHPTPTHPDENAFVSAIGFSTDYPVHAPGYPLWIAVGTLLRSVMPTPYGAYALASLIASIVGPALLFLWLRTRIDQLLAWITSLAFGLCPLAWFHSVTALTYWMATLFAIGIAMACERAIVERTARPLVMAASLLGVAIFLRTDCVIYFGPLFAWAWFRSRSMRARFAALVPVAAVIGFYLLMQYLYGRVGPTTFADRFGHSRDVLIGTSLFGAGLVDGLLRNCVKIGVNLAWNVGPLVVVCIASLFLKTDKRRPEPEGSPSRDSMHTLRRVAGIWLATALTFLALFHVVEGYFLWVLPAIFVGAAAWLQQHAGRRRATGCMAVALVLSAGQFLFYPWSSASVGAKRTIDAKISYLSAGGLLHIDERDMIHDDGDVWHIDAHDQTPSPE